MYNTNNSMEMALDEKWKQNFIKSIQHRTFAVEIFEIYTCVNYVILFNLLQFIPKDIIMMIHEYTKDIYVCELEINIIEDYTKGILINKYIEIEPDTIKINNLTYDIQINISYTTMPNRYRYIISRGCTNYITIKNRKTGSSTSINEFINHDDIVHDKYIPYELIEVVTFVINEIVQTLINANDVLLKN